MNDFERGFILGLNIGQQNSPYFRMIVVSDTYIPILIAPNNPNITLSTFNEQLSATPLDYTDNGISETYSPISIIQNLNVGIISITGAVTTVPR